MATEGGNSLNCVTEGGDSPNCVPEGGNSPTVLQSLRIDVVGTHFLSSIRSSTYFGSSLGMSKLSTIRTSSWFEKREKNQITIENRNRKWGKQVLFLNVQMSSLDLNETYTCLCM